MGAFSDKSETELSGCHPKLQRLFNEVVKIYDCTIICGHRRREDQERAFRKGTSKVMWPNSKHNRIPSYAVDVAPYFHGKGPFELEHAQYCNFAGYVKGVAQGLGIAIRWGGDWGGDHDVMNETFLDLVHFELIE